MKIIKNIATIIFLLIVCIIATIVCVSLLVVSKFASAFYMDSFSIFTAKASYDVAIGAKNIINSMEKKKQRDVVNKKYIVEFVHVRNGLLYKIVVSAHCHDCAYVKALAIVEKQYNLNSDENKNQVFGHTEYVE